MIQRDHILYCEPTPEELAAEFIRMVDGQQAAFFNELAKITDNPELTIQGRIIMEQIGKYGDKKGV
ncbi:MAG: hypothetical protein ACE5HN_08825 [Nitrospiria bacterium]